ncbi:MAG TPA: phage holin family protein [Flavobacteriales bacterium]|nr:phage holin family protein [Flavobacteriales bacterium]HIB78307.1 phage holin family protein [Flavobacteriales bacterium]
MKLLIKLIITAIAAVLTSYILPGVTLDRFADALLLAAVLALFNAFLKPVIVVLTIPVTVLTLGLFLLVINAALVLLADYLLAGFSVTGFWIALFFSIILTIINSILESILIDKKKTKIRIDR